MFRYDFRKWNGEQFAKLCNALLIETVSEKVRPFFTVGPDGGRDTRVLLRGEHLGQKQVRDLVEIRKNAGISDALD